MKKLHKAEDWLFAFLSYLFFVDYNKVRKSVE